MSLRGTSIAFPSPFRAVGNLARLQRVLLLTKVTKFDFERSLAEYNDNEAQLVNVLQRKGVNANWLLSRHNIHYEKVNELERALTSRQIEVRLVDRKSYTADAIAWADVIMTAGGDGTFLLGASKIRDRKKTIIGFNTDPEYSCGHLCMPKWCTYNVDSALDRILSGQFDFVLCNRLRSDLLHFPNHHIEMGLLDKRIQTPVENWTPDTGVSMLQSSFARLSEGGSLVPGSLREKMCWTRLPMLALNEVYVGQASSARVSQYEICVNNETATRQKSSGVVVATGTGSSAWYKQACSIEPEVVTKLFELANPGQQSLPGGAVDPATLAELYNSSLRFDPESNQMVYVIRDPLNNPVYKVDKPSGKVNSLHIRSLMLDAHLVLDGLYTFPFHYGSVVSFSIDPSDALSTIRLHVPP